MDLRLHQNEGFRKLAAAMKITDVLRAEHAVFHNLFDHIEATVPKLKTLAEVKVALKVEDQPVPPGSHRWPSLVEVVYAELTEKK